MKLPFMPFYGADFYDDEKVCLMDLAEEAVYLRLLWRQWREGSLPLDPTELAGVAKVPGITQRVLDCFLVGEDGRRRNPRLERIHSEHVDTAEKLSAAGKRGRAKQLAGPPPGQAPARLGQSDTESDTELPTVSNETGTAAQSHDRRQPEHTLRSCIGLVVEQLYFGNRPPEAAMRIEGSIAKQLGEHYGYDRLARAIEGLARRRNEGRIPNLGARTTMSLKWLNSKKFDLNQLAASEDAYYASTPAPRRGKSGLTDLGSVIANIGGEG